MPTGCCLLPCMTVCWPIRNWQSWRAAPTRRSLPRASSPRLLILPHRTAILKRRTPSLPCLKIPASTRLLCQLWQSGCMENSVKSKTVFLFICLKQPASTGCSSRVWVFPTSILQSKISRCMKPLNMLPVFEKRTPVLGVSRGQASFDFCRQRNFYQDRIMRSFANSPPLAIWNLASRSETCRFFFSSPATS